MKRQTAGILALCVAALMTPGCGLRRCSEPNFGSDLTHYADVALQIEDPDVEGLCDGLTQSTPSPVNIHSEPPQEYWDLTLEEAIQTALAQSQVLRDLGGAVLRGTEATRTVQDPSITETDPRIGVDAALSAFDAAFTASANFEKNDRAINNEILGGGTRLLSQDLAIVRAQLAKRAATGSQFFLRQNIDYDANNATGNLFPSAWQANIEGEIRQPLLQGAGTDFNRIAGPNNQPGVYTGVLVARVNTDIRLAEFEIGLRDLVCNVENTYWDLYYTYRDLDARIEARDAALETWRQIHALYEAEKRGGEAEKEAQAREQYFRFQEEVENALTGRLFEGTRTNNGSRGGTFRAIAGVQVAERRLRLMMGIPATDGRLIRPADEPVSARVVFDWHEVSEEALARRAELRRQKWQIKRRELELCASRNFLLPQLDTVGRYRWRGFGQELLESAGTNPNPFDNAVENLTGGKFQEWQLGVELTVPLGYRKGNVAVRNAQLLLCRERALLDEQERQVMHDLSNAVAEMERAYAVSQTTYNRRNAAVHQLAAVQAAYEADKVPLDQVLNAQRRVADGESEYFRTLVEYSLAIKNVHFEKGSLLDYNNVFLAEGPWPGKAYYDAARLEARRGRPRPLNYTFQPPVIVSRGPVPQHASNDHMLPQDEPLKKGPHKAKPPAEQVPTPAVEPVKPQAKSVTKPTSARKSDKFTQSPKREGQNADQGPVKVESVPVGSADAIVQKQPSPLNVSEPALLTDAADAQSDSSPKRLTGGPVSVLKAKSAERRLAPVDVRPDAKASLGLVAEQAAPASIPDETSQPLSPKAPSSRARRVSMEFDFEPSATR